MKIKNGKVRLILINIFTDFFNNFTKIFSSDDFRQGLKFYIDTNEDRQTNQIDSEFMIYLDSLGIQ